MSGRWGTAVLLLALAALLSMASSSSWVKRQAGRLPHPAPPLRSGQNIHDGRVQIQVGSSHLTGAGAVGRDQEIAQANEVMRHAIRSALKVRFLDDWDIGVLFDVFVPQGSIRTASPMPPTPVKEVIGVGLTMGHSLPLTRRWRLGYSSAFIVYAMPSERWELSACEAPLFQSCTLSDDINYTIRPALTASILPSFRALKWLTLFGGVDLRVAPFFEPIVVGEGEFLTDEIIRHDEDSIGWSFIASFGVGLEVSLGRFRLQTSVWWPVSRGPIRYYPVVSINIGLSLGDKPRVRGQLVPPTGPLPGEEPRPRPVPRTGVGTGPSGGHGEEGHAPRPPRAPPERPRAGGPPAQPVTPPPPPPPPPLPPSPEPR